MNATEAKNLLSAVPTESFMTDRFTNDVDKCCAVGHLVRLTSKDTSDFTSNNCRDVRQSLFDGVDVINSDVFEFARRKTNQYLKEAHGISSNYIDLSDVNNFSNINGYNQETPKERVIALLDDMIEAGY